MNQRKGVKRSSGSVLYWAVGALLALVLFSTWLTSGLFAKYITAGGGGDSARVAKGIQVELFEHSAVYNAGVYTLDEGVETTKNHYDRVIPGVDIPKDPTLRLTGTPDVDYWLYLEVIESDDFPEKVTYELADGWVEIGENQYKRYLDSGSYASGTEIPILKEDKLFVSQYYVGEDKGFSLKFEVRVEQAD